MAPSSTATVASPSSAGGFVFKLLRNVAFLEKADNLLTVSILVTSGILAFMVRLFAVIRFESIIHEFDPYFNYRSTKYLVENGFINFHNWFDDQAWYPLGRIVGPTIYPGLMVTAAIIHNVLHALNIPVDVRNVCVFVAPLFSAFTVFITYFFTKELKDKSSGLLAAAFIAIVPGYISRSVAGSYDNEGIAIFCLILTYFFWVKAVKTGSLFWSGLSALGYFYMVSAWGGYVFIINLIPLHVLALLFTGRFSHRVYIAYSTMYSIGTILSMQIQFVGFQPVTSSEHMAALGVFGLIQLAAFTNYVRSLLTSENFEILFRSVILVAGGAVFLVGAVLTATGKIAPWTGRFYSLLDPTYAKENIPIIASVSEHQPTTWASFFFDLQFLCILFPVGLYYCFKKLTDANIFIILYGITSIYFAGVMVRLMLVLAPVACVLGAIGISSSLQDFITSIDFNEFFSSASGVSSSSSSSSASGSSSKKEKASASVASVNYRGRSQVSLIAVGFLAFILTSFVFHSTWVTSEAYSSPSIVLAANGGRGERVIFDDFREAYYWLRQNTADDARIMSWWDYGYQITAIANRTVLVDNNTWNNTHIARVGKAMASNEDVAYEIMRELDVDYVLVLFGGLTGYSSDDINKFLWMIRIAGSCDPGVKESDYFTPSGEYKVDRDASKAMLNSLMYKLSFYRYGAVMTEYGKPSGYDRVRNAEIGNKDFELEHLEEAYTTEHWLVRIYKVKDLENRGNRA